MYGAGTWERFQCFKSFKPWNGPRARDEATGCVKIGKRKRGVIGALAGSCMPSWVVSLVWWRSQSGQRVV